MFCTRCGSHVEDGNSFCTSCGAPLDSGTSVPSAGASVSAGGQSACYTMPASDYSPGQPAPAYIPTQSMPVQPGQGAIAGSTSGKGGSKTPIIIAAAVVAVLAMAGAAIGLTQCGKDDGGELVTYELGGDEQQDSGSGNAGGTESAGGGSGDSGGTGSAGGGSGDSGGTGSTGASDSANGAKPEPKNEEKPEPKQDEKPQTSEGNNSNGNNGSTAKPDSKPASDGESSAADDRAKREEEARQAAIDAGKQVFTGRVIVTTYAERSQERVPDLHDFDSIQDSLVILQMDSSVPFRANAGDGSGMIDADGDSLQLPNGQFESYEGKTITIAVVPEEMWTFSDVAGALMDAKVKSAELIAPLDGNAPKPEASADADAGNGDYVLADSDSRYYSREELEKLDDLTLYHARNEIYARRGRQFVNDDLREFFGSKSWYSGTIAPGDFSDDMLNDCEKKNAELMLAIEQERNSPYLS